MNSQRKLKRLIQGSEREQKAAKPGKASLVH